MKFVIIHFLHPPVSPFSSDSFILISIMSPITSSLVYSLDVYSSRYFKIRGQFVCPAYAVSVGVQIGMRLDA
jgi:hypothetical protein